jgi:hypothetical protein
VQLSNVIVSTVGPKLPDLAQTKIQVDGGKFILLGKPSQSV